MKNVQPQITRAIRRGKLRSRPAKLLSMAVTAATIPAYLHLSGHVVAGAIGVVILLLLVVAKASFGTEEMLRKLPHAPEGLTRRVEEIAARAGIDRVHVRLGRTPGRKKGGVRGQVEHLKSLGLSVNACAADDLTPGRTVLVGENLLACLHEDEEDAVLSHEVAHLAHNLPGINVLAVLLAAGAGAAARVAFVFAVLAAWFTETPYGVWQSLGLLMALGLVRNLFTKFAARVEEHAADHTGSVLSGRPEHLASALLRINAGAKEIKRLVERTKSSNQSISDLLAVSEHYQEPVGPYTLAEIRQQARHDDHKPAGLLVRIRQTHPPVTRRVGRLLQHPALKH